MANVEVDISIEALEALRKAKPTGRPGLMVYDGLSQEVDPLLQHFEGSERARNFLFGRNVLHLGFSGGKVDNVVTAHRNSGLVTRWDVLRQRVIPVGVPIFNEERVSIRPRGNKGKQGLTEIKIPEGLEQPPSIMLPRSNFIPMTHVAAEHLPELFSATPRHELEPPQLTAVQ